MKPKVIVTGARGFIGRNVRIGTEFKGDICNFSQVLDSCCGADGILHLAAVSDKRMFDEDPKRGVATNLYGLCNVLEVALHLGLWVIFISSFQIKERHLYGLSKIMGEELCRIYQKKGVRIRIIRLPIVYGPGSRPDKAIARIITDLKKGKEPKIETDERFYFAYVKDVARMIESEVSLMREGISKRYSIREVRDTIKECLKHETT